LLLNNDQIDLKLLEDTSFAIETTDHDGINSSKEVKDFKLNFDGDTTYEFKVPEKLSRISFTLKGKVQNLSQNKKVDVFDSKAFDLNAIDKTEKIEDLHLRHVDGKYFLEVLGKNGEPRFDRPIQLTFKHRHFRRVIDASLQTDKNGRIELGSLKDMDTLTAKGVEGTSKTWILTRDRRTYPEAIHALAGSKISVPIVEDPGKFLSEVVSLLETRGSTYVQDFNDKIKYSNGFLVIDSLPPGDYELYLKKIDVSIKLKVTQGKRDGNNLLSRDRFLKARHENYLHISKVTADSGKKEIQVKIENTNKMTRVHVLATRFLPPENFFNALGANTYSGLTQMKLVRPLSQYVSGRNIGDEFRYILERKYANVFPGNMLRIPGLLLNPWSLRKTDTGVQEAQAGTAWSGAPVPTLTGASECEGKEEGVGAAGPGSEFSNLDFLPTGSLLLTNLKPDQNGMVKIDLEKIGPRQQIHVIALDGFDSVYREISLPQTPEKFKDLRLIHGLDSQKHFVEKKNISGITAKSTFEISDITTTKLEIYDSLARVYGLFQTLGRSPTLTEFAFILGWPELKIEKKRELYSKYACHELNFFLFKKDPVFFNTVIKPYLANKKDKTFLDRWLLDDDLTEFLKPWKF